MTALFLVMPLLTQAGSNLAYADKPSIPPGCPGGPTNIQVPLKDGQSLADYQKTVCDKNNPAGCPGSTESTKKKPDASKCKYTTASGNKSGKTTSGEACDPSNALSGCCAQNGDNTGDCVNTFCGSSTANASNTSCSDPAASCTASESANQCDLIQKYLNPTIVLMSSLVGIVVVISLILGGIQYSTSEGDPQKVSAAKNRLAKTIVALVAYIFLYALVQFLVPGGIK